MLLEWIFFWFLKFGNLNQEHLDNQTWKQDASLCIFRFWSSELLQPQRPKSHRLAQDSSARTGFLWKFDIYKTKANEAIESLAVESTVGIYKVVGSRLTKGWREGLINHDVLGNLGWGGWAGPTGQAPGSQFEEKAICFHLYKPAVMKRNVQTMRVVTQGGFQQW